MGNGHPAAAMRGLPPDKVTVQLVATGKQTLKPKKSQPSAPVELGLFARIPAEVQVIILRAQLQKEDRQYVGYG